MDVPDALPWLTAGARLHAAAVHATGSVLRGHPGQLLGDADVRLPSIDNLRPAGRTVRRQLRRREQPPGDVRLRVIQFGMSACRA
jgi:hypothetical protein